MARDADIYWRYMETEDTVSDLARAYGIDVETVWAIIEYYKRLEN